MQPLIPIPPQYGIDTGKIEETEEMEEKVEGGLIRTCHLCGKSQCGQRRGRVRCAYCKRVFCLQQLYKKFKIQAEAGDPNFRCPRCLKICCCVSDCSHLPPHAHCKVYKVRENKRRHREEAQKENEVQVAMENDLVESVNLKIAKERSSIQPFSFYTPDMSGIPTGVPTMVEQCGPYAESINSQPIFYPGDPTPNSANGAPLPSSSSSTITNNNNLTMNGNDNLTSTTTAFPVSASGLNSLNDFNTTLFGGRELIPPLQHSDWLTQLNMHILGGGSNSTKMKDISNLDEGEKSASNGVLPLSPTAATAVTTVTPPPLQSFVDRLRYFIQHHQQMTGSDLASFQSDLLQDADHLQFRAEKSDMLFRMVDTFNRNTIHVTTSWLLKNNSLFLQQQQDQPQEGQKKEMHALPALYTIVMCCPSVLFSLETNTSYGEGDSMSSVSITFFNTSTIKDVRVLCTCIHFFNESFQHYTESTNTELWTEKGISWKNSNNIDIELLNRMHIIGESARQQIQSSSTKTRIVISYSRVSEDNSFENLPILSIVLKRVMNDYPEWIYLLERMICDERRVVCVLLFNEDRDWVSIIRQYEVNLDVRRENPPPAVNEVNSIPSP